MKCRIQDDGENYKSNSQCAPWGCRTAPRVEPPLSRLFHPAAAQQKHQGPSGRPCPRTPQDHEKEMQRKHGRADEAHEPERRQIEGWRCRCRCHRSGAAQQSAGERRQVKGEWKRLSWGWGWQRPEDRLANLSRALTSWMDTGRKCCGPDGRRLSPITSTQTQFETESFCPQNWYRNRNN